MFSGELPLVVAGSGTKILKTNQFYFLFIQGCAACNIQVVKICYITSVNLEFTEPFPITKMK